VRSRCSRASGRGCGQAVAATGSDVARRRIPFYGDDVQICVLLVIRMVVAFRRARGVDQRTTIHRPRWSIAAEAAVRDPPWSGIVRMRVDDVDLRESLFVERLLTHVIEPRDDPRIVPPRICGEPLGARLLGRLVRGVGCDRVAHRKCNATAIWRPDRARDAAHHTRDPTGFARPSEWQHVDLPGTLIAFTARHKRERAAVG
jgi:hypothetical protein